MLPTFNASSTSRQK
jgi:hypothetical protein